jgi:hypothetical protein
MIHYTVASIGDKMSKAWKRNILGYFGIFWTFKDCIETKKKTLTFFYFSPRFFELSFVLRSFWNIFKYCFEFVLSIFQLI